MRLQLNEWVVDLAVDDDNHLSVWVSNLDDSPVIPVEADIAVGNTWAERFTTEKIEAAYES